MADDSISEWNTELTKIALYNIIILQAMTYTENAIIIFNIDNTLLDSTGKRMNPIITLYDYAKLLNIKIAIITRRLGTPENIEKTEKQLYKRCILNYNYIYFLKPLDVNFEEFKNNVIKDIKRKGHKIIMIIGYMEFNVENEPDIRYVKIPVFQETES